MIPALVIFALTYVLMLIFGKYRPYIALASGIVFIATGMLSFENTLLPRDIRQGKRVSPLLFSSFLPLSSSISEFSLEPRPQTCG